MDIVSKVSIHQNIEFSIHRNIERDFALHPLASPCFCADIYWTKHSTYQISESCSVISIRFVCWYRYRIELDSLDTPTTKSIFIHWHYHSLYTATVHWVSRFSIHIDRQLDFRLFYRYQISKSCSYHIDSFFFVDIGIVSDSILLRYSTLTVILAYHSVPQYIDRFCEILKHKRSLHFGGEQTSAHARGLHLFFFSAVPPYTRNFIISANNHRSWKQKTKQVIPVWCWNPHKARDSLVLVNSSGKNVLFAHSTSPLPQLLASRDTGHHQTSRAYAPLSWESSLPSLRAVGLAWDVRAWPSSVPTFCVREQEVSSHQKKIIQKWVRFPRPRQELETQTTYGPQPWQRGLSV